MKLADKLLTVVDMDLTEGSADRLELSDVLEEEGRDHEARLLRECVAIEVDQKERVVKSRCSFDELFMSDVFNTAHTEAADSLVEFLLDREPDINHFVRRGIEQGKAILVVAENCGQLPTEWRGYPVRRARS